MMRIDLNCDLGEGCGNDAELMPLITSANIACGAHAGDELTMRATVALALHHGVAIGAHPGFADREHFGRHELAITPAQSAELIVRQVQALQKVARSMGAVVSHVKLHGALYNIASRDRDMALATAGAVWASDRNLLLFALAGSELEKVSRSMGLRVAEEVFADRTYQRDGALTPRSQPDALIHDEDVAVAQVLRMVREGTVRATDGTEVTVAIDTVCLHGDGPHAVAFARRLNLELRQAGVDIRAFGT